jgi:TonB family protein
MRRILLSTLFLSTALVQAQTAGKGQSGTLEARNESTNAISSTQPAADGGGIPSARRISTGVVWPKLISEPTVRVSAADFPTSDLTTQHVVVSFRVDEKGLPEGVHLLKSVNYAIDERVLDAVRQYRFVPGTLDNQNVAVDVNLIVNFAKN